MATGTESAAADRSQYKPAAANGNLRFFIDLAGHVDDEPMDAALAEPAPPAAQIKIVGSYPAAVS